MIDVGPVGGTHGGHIVARGHAERAARGPGSVTGRALARAARAPGRAPAARAHAGAIELIGAREHNLKDVDLRVPLGRFVRRHRRQRLGQEHARARGAAARRAQGARPRRRASGRARRVRVPAHQARGRDRPEPDRSHAALGARDLRRRVGRDPQAARADARGARARLRRLALLVQRRRRAAAPTCEGQGALDVEMSFLPDA